MESTTRSKDVLSLPWTACKSASSCGGPATDPHGHGTHVAGIIAGQPGRTADARTVQGVAPDAFLINVRVLTAEGWGTVASLIDAIDWVIDHKAQYNIRVINISAGAPALQACQDDPACGAVQRAWAAGIVVVAAVGNNGLAADGRKIYGAVNRFGIAPEAITCGAIDTHGTPARSDDTVPTWSSRGPTAFDHYVKPDLVAPGVHIVSAEAQGSYLSKEYPDTTREWKRTKCVHAAFGK